MGPEELHVPFVVLVVLLLRFCCLLRRSDEGRADRFMFTRSDRKEIHVADVELHRSLDGGLS